MQLTRVARQRLSHLTILLILLLALALRLYRLDAQALRGDEAATVLYSAMPLNQLWELARITDPHPPLYYALLHPWQQFLGRDAWLMRFTGVIASVLAVAALYRLARLTLRRTGLALLAVALLAVNPLQIWLAQDIRSYPLFTLWGLLSAWALWAALTRRRRADWLLYVAITVASLYTHYYTVFLIAFEGLFALVNYQKFWAGKWRWLTAQLAIGLLIIPGLSLAYHFVGGEAGGGVAKLGLPQILQRTGSSLLTGFTLEDAWGPWLCLLLLPVVLVGVVALLRQNRTSASFWALFFAAPTLGVIVLSIDRPFFKERFLIQAQPAFELLLAAGFLALWNGQKLAAPVKWGLRLTAGLLVAGLLAVNYQAMANYHTNPAYAKAPPWNLYHDLVAGKTKPGDVMLTNFPEASVSYYSPAGLPFYVVPSERGLSAAEREAQTQQIAAAYQRIWFLPLLNEGFDEHGDVLNWLDRHADRIDQIFFPTYNLNLYLSPTVINQTMIAQPAQFSHGARLRGFQILDKRGNSRLAPPDNLLALKPGDDFTVSLYWQSDGPTAEPYTVFVHLLAADGFNRTNQDNQPVWGAYPTTQWQPGEQITDRYTLKIPPGAPPGDHHLNVGWYNAASGARAPLLNSAGQPAADALQLDAVIRVESE